MSIFTQGRMRIERFHIGNALIQIHFTLYVQSNETASRGGLCGPNAH